MASGVKNVLLRIVCRADSKIDFQSIWGWNLLVDTAIDECKGIVTLHPMQNGHQMCLQALITVIGEATRCVRRVHIEMCTSMFRAVTDVVIGPTM